MSRSVRKTPVFGFTNSVSEKLDKQKAHRTLRAHFRSTVCQVSDVEALEFDERSRAHSNRRCHAKGIKRFEPGMRTQRLRRGLRMLSVQLRMASPRATYRQLAK